MDTSENERGLTFNNLSGKKGIKPRLSPSNWEAQSILLPSLPLGLISSPPHPWTSTVHPPSPSDLSDSNGVRWGVCVAAISTASLLSLTLGSYHCRHMRCHILMPLSIHEDGWILGVQYMYTGRYATPKCTWGNCSASPLYSSGARTCLLAGLTTWAPPAPSSHSCRGS